MLLLNLLLPPASIALQEEEKKKERYPPGLRAAAVKAYYSAGGNMAAAVRLFNEQRPRHNFANPFDFIKYWVAMFDRRFSVLDAPAPGPAPALSNDLAEECITLLLSGYKTEKNQQRYFRSSADAVQRSEQLRDIMASAASNTQQHYYAP